MMQQMYQMMQMYQVYSPWAQFFLFLRAGCASDILLAGVRVEDTPVVVMGVITAAAAAAAAVVVVAAAGETGVDRKITDTGLALDRGGVTVVAADTAASLRTAPQVDMLQVATVDKAVTADRAGTAVRRDHTAHPRQEGTLRRGTASLRTAATAQTSGGVLRWPPGTILTVEEQLSPHCLSICTHSRASSPGRVRLALNPDTGCYLGGDVVVGAILLSTWWNLIISWQRI